MVIGTWSCRPKISKIILAASRNTAQTKIQSAIDSPQRKRQAPPPAMAEKVPKSLERKPIIIANRKLQANMTQEPQNRMANTQHTAGIKAVTESKQISISAISRPVINAAPDIQVHPQSL